MLTTLSVLALILAALCWVVGDALIVGFRRPDPVEHADFIALMGDDAYAFYTRVDEPRLRAGALVADYAAPVWLVGLWAHWELLKGTPVVWAALGLLGAGYVLSPLAHASFYPLALASERAHRLWERGEPAEDAVRHAQRLRRLLVAAWVPSVGALALGWLLVGLAIGAGATALPRWAALLTPLPQAVPWSLLPRIPYPGKPLLDGAMLNIVQLVWGVALLILIQRYPLG